MRGLRNFIFFIFAMYLIGLAAHASIIVMAVLILGAPVIAIAALFGWVDGLKENFGNAGRRTSQTNVYCPPPVSPTPSGRATTYTVNL